MQSGGPPRYLNQAEATSVDSQFFGVMEYTLDQLMELAGLSVALCVAREFPPVPVAPRILVLCGPGNNGGDGLVCARHLSHFGYSRVCVHYPKPGKNPFFSALLRQLEAHGIRVLTGDPVPRDVLVREYDLLIDAVFGYSFKPPLKRGDLFGRVVQEANESGVPVVSVDVPSGWDVDREDGGVVREESAVAIRNPKVVVSLSAPKVCVKGFSGAHYLGGRFVPPKMAWDMGLNLPYTPGSDLVVKL